MSSIVELLNSGKSFAYYCLPNSEDVNICVDGSFDGESLQFDGIRFDTWLHKSYERMTPTKESISQQSYFSNLHNLIAELQLTRSKAVICRQICNSTICSFAEDKLEVEIEKYFKKVPNALRFFVYHPSVGFWLGATPEMLVERKRESYFTQALAGTRPKGIAKDWDEKNLVEHSFVVDDISANLTSCGLPHTVAPVETWSYAEIEHLRTEIEISHRNMNLTQVSERLHPTPAVLGYPRAQAETLLKKYDCADRKFYGGLITLPTMVYVTLRCMHFDIDGNYCIYTGSGITAQSSPADEWLETEAKAAPLLSLVKSLE